MHNYILGFDKAWCDIYLYSFFLQVKVNMKNMHDSFSKVSKYSKHRASTRFVVSADNLDYIFS